MTPPSQPRLVLFPGLGADDPGVPVHHIHGQRDRVIPCKRSHPDHIIPRAGHLANLTHADEVNHFITNILSAPPLH